MAAATTYKLNDVENIKSFGVPSEELALLRLAKSGDLRAFESLALPQRDSLIRVTQRILRNREDAEDAVQNAFLDAFRNLKSFQGHSRFSSWLTRIAMNSALMRLRTNRRKQETSLDQTVGTGTAQGRFHPAETRPNPEQEYLFKECRALLKRGLQNLKPLHSEVLLLHCVQELSAKEAARLLDVPVGTIKARLHRARTQLFLYTQSMLKSKRSPMRLRKQGAVALMRNTFV